MDEWDRRRRWTSSSVREASGGYFVALDDSLLETPAKRPAKLPTRAAAELVANEWGERAGRIRPAEMPFTRLAFSAIDGIAQSRSAAVAEIAGYGGTDLVCYRADAPPELARRQGEAWDPLLAWCESEFGAPLNRVRGAMHAPQPEASLSRLRRQVARLGDFELAALFDLVALTGSLVLGLAVERGFLGPEDAWRASRIEEGWNLERWGADAEALESAEAKRRSAIAAAAFLDAVRDGGRSVSP